jgi:hypothetical protein
MTWYSINCARCGVPHKTQRRLGTYCSRRCAGLSQPRQTEWKSRYRIVRVQDDHPLMDAGGLVPMHRIVLSDHIGLGPVDCHWCSRPLDWFSKGPDMCVVDHLDNNGQNNDIENLVPSCAQCNKDRGRRPDWLTHCVNGHEYTPENTLVKREGGRRCRKCHRDYERERRTVLRRKATAEVSS